MIYLQTITFIITLVRHFRKLRTDVLVLNASGYKNTIIRIYIFIPIFPQIIIISGMCLLLGRLLGFGVFSPFFFWRRRSPTRDQIELVVLRLRAEAFDQTWCQFSYMAARASRLPRNLLQAVAPVDTIDRGHPASDE